ncbi:Na+/H+ antiporter subunit G [Phragmitibacter flavus]|uniref:Na+/H+ antiporter subunit G n=1 Tax=Phragmitibacter flavus TaxID=2576071 RepID=A0A5R8KA20_9BACT|nr:monovalent cation/H(+) antiporter subunit G [Phragmitibacter flavus]TLD69158.1 Na+/H+ antiporter subunit G [Phragmitibacter flavus]
MIEIIASIIALLGALFALVAALGIIRLPDVYTRMHAASKASSFALGLLLLAVIVLHPTLGVIVKSVLSIFFIYLTVPVAAHLIGRAAYLHKVPLDAKTIKDELKGKYSADHQKLDS